MAEGDRVEGLPQVTRILTPLGCHFELACCAVSMAGGENALICQPAMDDARVLARTGDPAPGLPGLTLEAFGPPVASSGLPLRRPLGVASPVRQSHGQRGILVATLAGHAILPVLDGDLTDDSRRLPVSDPMPVKLTNTGTLLIRAELGPPDNRRDSLLVIGDLFGDG